MNRISKNDYYLGIALAVSKRSTCLKRHYGAVIVKNDEIVATGYNGAARNEQNCCDVHTECPRKNAKHNSGDYSDCPAVHAEQNALLSVSRDKAIGAILYLTDMILPWKTESRMNTKWQNVNLAQSVNE